MALPITQLTELAADQIDQYVTVNEALRGLEALSFRVLSDSTDAEPGSPAEGDSYIITASASGTDWGTFTANDVAIYVASEWLDITPWEGLSLWVNDNNTRITFDGTNWIQEPALYVEGTWTPVLSDAATGGNDASFTSNEASYTRIGREVTVYLDASAIDTTGMTGGNDLFITGLPYTAGAVGLGMVDESSIAFSGYLVAKVDSGNTYCKLIDCTTGAADSPTTVSNLTSTSARIQMVLRYQV